MTTTVRRVNRDITPDGPLFSPSKITVINPGKSPGISIWRNIGRPIITTVNQMLASEIQSTFGRAPIVKDRDEPFMFSNDVIEAEAVFRVKKKASAKRRTVYFRFADLGDQSTGNGLWFNGVSFPVPRRQRNASVLVIGVTTDETTIAFRWRCGSEANPDGFAMLLPCLDVI